MKNQRKQIYKFLPSKFIHYGLHLGGLKSFWNPHFKAYMAGFRNNFCILDPSLTHRGLRHALKFLSKIVISKKKILFLGSPLGLEKKFSSLCQSSGHYHLAMPSDGIFTNFTKKEKEILPIDSLKDRPSLIVFFDISQNEEGKKAILRLNIPILAFVGSSGDLSGIDYPIPANVKSWKGGLFVYNLFHHILSLSQRREEKRKA